MTQDFSNQDLFNKLKELLNNRDYDISYVTFSTSYAGFTLLKSTLKDYKIVLDSETKTLSLRNKQDESILRINYAFIQNWYIDSLPTQDEFYFGFFSDEFSSEKSGLRIKILFKN